MLPPGHNYTTYLAASYVKWVEGAGAMQVLSGFLRQVARAERLSSYSPRASFAKHFTRATLISINVLVE